MHACMYVYPHVYLEFQIAQFAYIVFGGRYMHTHVRVFICILAWVFRISRSWVHTLYTWSMYACIRMHIRPEPILPGPSNSSQNARAQPICFETNYLSVAGKAQELANSKIFQIFFYFFPGKRLLTLLSTSLLLENRWKEGNWHSFILKTPVSSSYSYAYMNAYAANNIYVCMYMYIYQIMYTYTYIYIYMYTHTHIHINTYKGGCQQEGRNGGKIWRKAVV